MLMLKIRVGIDEKNIQLPRTMEKKPTPDSLLETIVNTNVIVPRYGVEAGKTVTVVAASMSALDQWMRKETHYS